MKILLSLGYILRMDQLHTLGAVSSGHSSVKMLLIRGWLLQVHQHYALGTGWNHRLWWFYFRSYGGDRTRVSRERWDYKIERSQGHIPVGSFEPRWQTDRSQRRNNYYTRDNGSFAVVHWGRFPHQVARARFLWMVVQVGTMNWENWDS